MTEEMRQAIIAEVSEYCKSKFEEEDWDLMKRQALACWGRKEPVPSEFEMAISDAWEEWIQDNFEPEDFI